LGVIFVYKQDPDIGRKFKSGASKIIKQMKWDRDAGIPVEIFGKK
jgi:hypothetical protein